MQEISGNLYLAEVLAKLGTDYFFHVPVIAPEAVIEMTNLGLHPIVAHTEKAAAYMADGYARASGRIGVCGSQAIGAANLAAGLVDAYMARSPVLAITGGKTAETHERNQYQEYDQRPFYEGTTKFRSRVETITRLPGLLNMAIREATSGQPGPTHLELAGFWGALLRDTAEISGMVDETFAQCPPCRPQASNEQVDAILKLFAQSERPIIVAGSGVRASRAAQAVQDFVHATGAAFVSSLDAKACLPESDPFNLGVAGDYSRDTANKAMAAADLVLFVGSTTGSMTTRNWSLPPAGTTVAQIDIEPKEIGRNFPTKAAAIGDPGAVLGQLLAALPAQPDRSAWHAQIKELRAEWAAIAEPLESCDSVPLKPERIMRELSDALPEDAMVVVDTGHSAAWAARHLYLNHPGQDLLRAAGSLGWSFPAALGAKCAVPDRPVICFCGDGGFLYHLGELETALRYGINTVTVVNHNASFSQERFLWRDEPAHQKNWVFERVDLATTAESFGCAGFRVTQPGELGAAMEAALQCGRPSVIEVAGDPMTASPPSWGPGEAQHASFYGDA